MELKEGKIYHIKDEFFEKMNGYGLMNNHEKGHSRPTYFMMKYDDMLWFVPLSSKVEKYRKIVDHKISRFGYCKSIIITKLADQDSVILIQNSFPILEKYISHIHLVNGKPIYVPKGLKKEIIDDFKYLLSLKKEGINLFFTDIDKIKEILIEETMVYN